MKKFLLVLVALWLEVSRLLAADTNAAPPNVIFILTDDMGCGDLSVLGGQQGPTPHLDQLAGESLRFSRYYVASPICSASRTAYTTGMYPSRWRINSYLHNREGNRLSEQADWLATNAPAVARAFKQAGYATAHFGKWHMGGGRDVQDAPLPSAYGFDESHVNCEGLGPRFVNFGNAQTATLNTEDHQTYFRYDFTQYWVNRSIDFIKRHRNQPFYLELWPQDVHTPHDPSEEAMSRTETPGLPLPQHKFRAVLNEYDRQIGRFLETIRDMGLESNTIVVFSSDNGPEPSFNHARTLGQRGMKWSLYEGGIREPFMVRWPGHIPAGMTNDATILASVDYFPTICALTGVKPPAAAAFDGVNQSAAWLGAKSERTAPLFWEYGRKPDGYLYPNTPGDKSPNVAMRAGKWKLLINADGSDAQLYDVETDWKEKTDLTAKYPDITKTMTEQALAWRRSLP